MIFRPQQVSSIVRRLKELGRAPHEQWTWAAANEEQARQLRVVRDWVTQPDFTDILEQAFPGGAQPSHPCQAWNAPAVPHAPAVLAPLKETKIGELGEFMTTLLASGDSDGAALLKAQMERDRVLITVGYAATFFLLCGVVVISKRIISYIVVLGTSYLIDVQTN